MDDYMEIEMWGLEEGELYEDLTPAGWWEPNNGYEVTKQKLFRRIFITHFQPQSIWQKSVR